MTGGTAVSPLLRLAAAQVTAQLMREVKGVKAVLVSTEDGFEVAAQVENTAQISRLSAMASSLAALGALAGEENRLGTCDSLVMEATDGLIAILQIHRPDTTLILSVVTGRDAIIGQVLYFSKQMAQALQKV
jgi:predicted regulator of Ras-like GTPase activity (Roadblock/LC7/MglB family)